MGLRKNYADFTNHELVTRINRLSILQIKRYRWNIEHNNLNDAAKVFNIIDNQMYYIEKEIRKRKKLGYWLEKL
jgi:hypothetical protein